MLGAVVFGHDQQQIVIQNINDLVKEALRLEAQDTALSRR
jgi:hypothetical protein